MQTIRHAQDRGIADFGWLHSSHSFSFGSYHDPRFMGFGPLRVINEDRVQPGRGFDTHAHQDMEIISYVIDGELAHKDSLGTGSVIRPGDLQRMSAGTGVRHSEFNPSQQAPVHFLQIWIVPERPGLPPSYEQKSFSRADKTGTLKLIGSRDGREGSVTIQRDVNLYAAVLDAGQSVVHAPAPDRKVWVQVVRGELRLGATPLRAGDGAALQREGSITLTGSTPDAEVLLFEMA